MSTTPLWFTLLIAALGIAGSVTTAVLTQHRADRREEVRWSRDSQRERESRNRDARAAAYISFLKSWDEHYSMVQSVKQNATDGSAPQVHLDTLYLHLIEVEVFGTRAAVVHAKESFEMLKDWSHSPATAEIGNFSIIDTLRRQIRTDLAVQD